jgi:hypothetical protein
VGQEHVDRSNCGRAVALGITNTDAHVDPRYDSVGVDLACGPRKGAVNCLISANQAGAPAVIRASQSGSISSVTVKLISDTPNDQLFNWVLFEAINRTLGVPV